jgi:DNA-binding MarR family transcriptional regulator
VKRETSPNDRRSFVVSLTREGRNEAAKIHALLESLEKRVLRRGDRRALESFDQLIRNLEQTASLE